MLTLLFLKSSAQINLATSQSGGQDVSMLIKLQIVIHDLSVFTGTPHTTRLSGDISTKTKGMLHFDSDAARCWCRWEQVFGSTM